MKVENELAAMKVQDPNASKSPGTKALTQEDFMKLFLAQMKQQDPMKPFDSGDMMQQMSQLTSMTASQGLEKSIKMMNTNLGNSQVLTAAQLIGKQVVYPSTVSPLAKVGDNSILNGSVIVPSKAASINITIKDKAGEVVKEVNLPGSESGVVDFTWDGKDKSGKLLDPDYYTISATANINNKNVGILTGGYFKVNSVTLDHKTSDVVLNLDGIGGTKMSEIIKILS